MDANEQVYLVSSSPHAHCGLTVRRIMLDVVIALAPAMAAAVIFFGLDAVRLTVTCVVSCVLTEALCRRMMGRASNVGDLSAVVTGILLAFNLPSSLPIWTAVVGSVVSIAVAKQAFGGLGYNPFNPALAARAFLLVSRPQEMTTWSAWIVPAPPGTDAVTNATPLGLAKASPFPFDAALAWDFFLGRMNGCVGEVSALALCAGGLYLLLRRCISWHTPVFFVGTAAAFASVLWAIDPAANMHPAFHVLTGGLMLGALFMATDMVTTPVTAGGKALFGIGCGAMTMVIRKWGSLPEGVSFAILIMNSLTPLINRITRPRVFGHAALGKGTRT
jgi:electron transport complex protein RnfD